MKRLINRGFALAAGLLFCIAGADAQQIHLEQVVVAPGGGTATDGTVTMQYTVAQPVAGTASNSEITGAFGFWNQAPSISSVGGQINAGTIAGVSVTPTPLNGEGLVRITTTARGLVDVQIYNATGEASGLLYHGEHEAGTFALPIAAGDLASGAYFIVVRMPGAMLQVPLTVAR